MMESLGDHAGKPTPKAAPLDPNCALLSVKQMTLADRLSVEAGVNAVTLMSHAGRAVSREVQRRWRPRPVTVLCGPGNNGGDGFVVAQRLSLAGWPVRVALLGSIEQLVGEAHHHAMQWQGPVETLAPSVLDHAELVVDALFGAGLNRALAGAAAQTLAAAAARRLPLVAIDVPSGLMGDSGESLGAVAATLTVTFFRKKPAHVLLPGRALCGEVVVTDIGTPDSVMVQVHPDTFENEPRLWSGDLPQLQPQANKYTRGHALVFGGYPLTGAARLSARAAARVGAGLTTVAVPQIALPIYASALTSIMVHPLAEPQDVTRLLEDRRLTALLIGPGAGVDAQTRARTLELLATGRPVVLDADALTAFQTDPTLLDRAITGACVMTPHEGEFARLFQFEGDKITRARTAARRSGAVIVLKGSDTVIAAPDGRAIVNTNAPASLATAGTGDVLAGLILGLLAQGMDPFLGAAAAVWLHGAAAQAFGTGLMAEDLPDLLPAVLTRLQSNAASASDPI